MEKPSETLRRTFPWAFKPVRILGDSAAGDAPPSAIPLAADSIQTLYDPVRFRETLHELIAQARRRITLAALYLQNDDAGKEVMEHLHEAKRLHPALDINVLVDYHRARRCRIGEESKGCNVDFYQECTQNYGEGVKVFGVPIQTRELFGVLHLKGFIFDDTVLYSGASINDVYLARHGRYRLDRYHVIRNAELADAMDGFLKENLLESQALLRLDQPEPSRHPLMQSRVRQLRSKLRKARFCYASHAEAAELTITPLAGLGSRGNLLNKTLVNVAESAKQRLVIFTPYFNLPRAIRTAIIHLLKSGVEVQIVLGEKEASDFYIPPDEKFSAIGLLPYLYEANLRRFARKHQGHMDSGKLNIHLWRHDNNTYHLKGMFVDGHTIVLTGNNLNPRAWSLDLENALIVSDPQGQLGEQSRQELQGILAHATRLGHYKDLQSPKDYPEKVQRLIKRLRRVSIDRLVNRIM